MPSSKSLPIVAAVLGVVIAATPSHASLVADGITYTLSLMPLTATEDQFTLGISGINGPSDTEGGRSGVNGFAFTPPANFSSATAAPGFTEMAGGANAMGCNGAGNFFCETANTTPSSTPALSANSSLSFIFDVTISSGSFAGYNPDFKIEWVGSNNHYDLVSETLTPVTVPAPVIGHGLPVLLAVGGFAFGAKLLQRNRKRFFGYNRVAVGGKLIQCNIGRVHLARPYAGRHVWSRTHADGVLT
jgi:hypothetical protein